MQPGFEELFHQQFEPMKRLAFLLGADDAENIAQEAFLRLHRRWPGLREPDKALAYLHRTVVNLAKSRLRHLRVVRRAPREEPGLADSAEVHVLTGLVGGSVRAALAQLTERQRQVLVLRYWLGLDQAAIGGALGIAVGTVKATNSQALDRLRTLLTTEEVR
ncbi:RNA polymerase sigma factor [Labedaea rhizosphaerae]|uniref:RNA polymerase sigma factor (Sigma-70 family) n=1 Tax=Labedaea rhizosphaerae TaxID=598644 RepID=A0A4R6SMV1_LABRH|nr:sigma-70 family RNA polymerase sigma factor [Labedaea rhizosphaerae]TDQ05231.1 RNA polymerase sigma factor (sigma-70 family) [Labedaea rhizosphaerae]